ncbi:TetR/AcrR family transcriptional regulator [Actinomadura sp. DC4]|uniref:TetR/AcrR family transcriptional regulator n=1 Tax=Actinomadura sp. DC4 TaxID=3055069 RepID=UPI0025AFE5F6|nr:TetR/AcrR family transcriptional regulator [Actinomadura sp. DC4]MDN3353761.1 TetR/AcrR family transcriptional regulator [Actinomadura sp. DC4]
MPRLWDDTIEAHRRTVRDTTLDTAAALVAEHGLTSVTMSRIAEQAGIARATLYRYFSDVESIMVAWHERQVDRHLSHLAEIGTGTGGRERLAEVLTAYGLIQFEHRDNPLAALLHQGDHLAGARRRLTGFVESVIAESAAAGGLRDDVPPGELAGYCLHALTAAGDLPSETAVRRLVNVTLTGLRPPA